MGDLAQARMRAGAVDHDEIAARIKIGYRRRQPLVIDVLVRSKAGAVNLGQVDQEGRGQVQIAGGNRALAVFEIPPETALAQVEIEPADAALLRLAEISAKDLDTRADTPGDGAAGGLGFGLRCFAGGILRPGFDLFAEQAPIRLQGCAILSHVMVGARKLSTHPAARIAHAGRFGKGPIELGGCAVFAQ